MRLFDRLLDRYSVRAGQGYYEGMASGAAVLMTFGTDNNREVSPLNLVAAAQQAYETNGLIFAATVVGQMMLGEASFMFRSKVDKHMYGTEDLRILEYPWPNGTSSDLWARMWQDVTTAGNTFWWQAEPDLLVRLPPNEVTILSEIVTNPSGGTYRNLIGYDWDPSLATPGLPRDSLAQTFTVEEIMHWAPYPDPMAKFRGMSWVSPILQDVYSDSALTGYKTQYLDHGTPITAVKYAAKLRPDTIDSIIERLQTKYGGVGNAWRPIVFDQGADPIMGMALKDLDFRAIQASHEARICAASGVPEILLGFRNENSNETYQTAMRKFADVTCRPLWRSGCAALTKLVPNFPPKGVELWFDTSDIAALQAAETERAQVIQVSAAATLTLIQAGFTRESVMAAVTAADLSQLVPDPDAPTPGVVERETITGGQQIGAEGQVVGNEVATAAPQQLGQAPGNQTVLTKPQTPASKTPAPNSIPTPPSGTGRKPVGSNGKG